MKSRLRIGLSMLAWAVLFGGSLMAHAKNSADPLIFNDDARQQIWPFFRYSDGLFRGDYIADYYLNAFLPAGYRLLFTSVAFVVDPVTTSKFLPYALLAVTVLACALAAYRLQGAASFFAAGVLALSGDTVFARMMGALPHRGRTLPARSSG